MIALYRPRSGGYAHVGGVALDTTTKLTALPIPNTHTLTCITRMDHSHEP